jgi:GAF domain-containing protein
MAHQGLSTLPARDLVVPSSWAASATGPLAVDGLVAELSPYWRGDLPAHRLDFQRIVSQAVQLAEILTGASGSAIAFRGEQGTICLARSGEGAPPLGAPVDTTSGISKQCLDSGTSLCCDDIATDGRVDPEISRAIGIRAVAVVPIYSDGEISGILEVFSRAPGIFADQHLQRLQQLANWIGSAANTPCREPIGGSNVGVQVNSHPDITLLVELEPPYQTFFRNLADLVSLRSPVRLARSSSQLHGWNDVLVDSGVPWRRFLESVFLHIVVVGMLAGLSEIWPRELLLSPRSLHEAHVTYYSFSQSFPARASSRPAFRPRLKQTGLGAATSVLPPPDIGEAATRPSHLPNTPVVPPPPDLSGGSGLHRMNAPRAGVVPPPPDLRGSMTRAGLIAAGRLGSVSAGAADLSIVPPPPSINDHAVLTSGARGNLSTTGVQVVAPPPSVQAGAKPDGRGRAISLAGEGSQVVPPPPSLEGAGNFVGGGRTNSLANGVSQVVPPPPSVEGGGNSGTGGRASSLARAGAEGVLPPASAQGAGNPRPSGARVANDAPTPSVPEVGGNRMHPIFQDVQLRVIGLAWAPPRSSYFSNFEVFIAEKGPNKEESQLIKLVYVFLPYQPRLSEYGFDNLKVRWLRVARDPTCDEGLMQMMRPEGENGPAGYHSGDALASTSSDRNNVLPCYRTTADDYRRAVSRSR